MALHEREARRPDATPQRAVSAQLGAEVGERRLNLGYRALEIELRVDLLRPLPGAPPAEAGAQVGEELALATAANARDHERRRPIPAAHVVEARHYRVATADVRQLGMRSLTKRRDGQFSRRASPRGSLHRSSLFR